MAMLGEAQVGKSAITGRYLFKKFQREYAPTIEDTFTKRTLVDDELAEMDILDTAGLEEYHSVSEPKLHDRDGYIVVIDLANAETLERVDKLYNRS